MFELYLLIFLLIIVLSIVISAIKIGISPMPTSNTVAKEILEQIQYSKGDTIYELGSGFGNLAIYLASNLPDKKVVAYELSLIPWLISLFLKKVLAIKNLEIYKKDFLKVDLKDAILVCYLFPKGMENLENKLFDESINTTIISNTFAFRNIKERKTIKANDFYNSSIYLYKT